MEAFSYEDLYELLRAEKASSDLEKLTAKDLVKIAGYFKAKEELLKQQEVSTAFSSTKQRVKIQLEIDNAMQMLRDLFERREAKVINRAVFSVRSDSKLKDTTNMLEHEERVHNALLDLLDENKKAFFDLVEEYKTQVIEEPKLKKDFKSAAEIESEPEEPAGKKIKFLTDTVEFVDEQLKKCGPFKQGDVAELPVMIVDILVRQGKAEIV